MSHPESFYLSDKERGFLSPGGLKLHDGWGQPRLLSRPEADAWAAEAKTQHLCGATQPSVYFGVLVCDHNHEEDEIDRHCDSRHAVVWPREPE